MKINRFEDIIAWQKSKFLTTMIYKKFSNHKDYGFKDQICRASLSIMNKIAEGFERGSNKEFRHFLFIAKGSAAEVKSMLYLAKELNYITEEEFYKFFSSAEEITKIISGLIKTL